MDEKRVQRRLTAVLAADVVGYARMVRADEEAAVAALKAVRLDIFQPRITSNAGRVFKLMGDGMLVEFHSIVDAVRTAVEIQRALGARNASLPKDRWIEFRMGVNLGDVIIDGDDIQGDGVNVAARLERLSQPGGICISAAVYEQVRDKVDLAFEDLGDQRVKNIERPVHAWHWSATGNAPVLPVRPAELPADSDRPSIAVLPFQNMSGDPEQEYFADGIVEEIITALSRFSWLSVAARNSSFTYKGRAVDVRKAAAELGVRYVLEGSVRRAGQRIRITGQLIDATTGAHIWADRFDGELADIFDFQDDVTASVVGAIEPSLRKAEIERARRKRPDSLAAYDLFLRALTPLKRMRPEPTDEALKLLERAIEIDPGYAPALAYAAWCHEQRLLHDWSSSPESDADSAVRLARQSLAIDSGDAAAIALSGFVLTIVAHDFDSGRAAAERALALNPNSATVCWMAGWVIVFAGEPEAAIPVFERSLRLSPLDPQANFLLNGMAISHLILGRPERAFDCASKALALDPDVDITYYALIPACGHLGRTAEAGKAIAKLQTLIPGITVSGFDRRMPFRDSRHLDVLVDGLRKAGLPE